MKFIFKIAILLFFLVLGKMAVAQTPARVILNNNSFVVMNNTVNIVIDNDNDEITAIEESESILDEAMSIMPMRRLNWHYRSKHQSLIAFSNYAFYDDSLKVFPSASGISTELGLQYSRLEGLTTAGGDSTINSRVVVE